MVAPDASDRDWSFHVAVLEEVGEGEQAGVHKNFERTLATLSAFSTIERVSLPDLLFAAMAEMIIDAEAAAAFNDLIKSSAVFDLNNVTRQLGTYRVSAMLARDCIKANRMLTKAQYELDALLAGYNALVAPARSSVANLIKESLCEYFAQFRSPPGNAAANVNPTARRHDAERVRRAQSSDGRGVRWTRG